MVKKSTKSRKQVEAQHEGKRERDRERSSPYFHQERERDHQSSLPDTLVPSLSSGLPSEIKDRAIILQAN